MERKVDVYEPEVFTSRLPDYSKQSLEEGDVYIEHEGVTYGIERKTLTDAYNSWTGQRLDTQLLRLCEVVDRPLLIVEHQPYLKDKWIYKKRDLDNLFRHLNRISMELCPVMFTSSVFHSVDEILNLEQRIADGKVRQWVSREPKHRAANKYNNVLQSIPRIGPTRAKEILAKFDSFEHFVANVEQLSQFVKQKDYNTIVQFVKKKWETKV